MIVWRGAGILVLIAYVGGLPFCAWLVDAIAGLGWYAGNRWAQAIVLLALSFPLWWVGVRMNPKRGTLVVDDVTGGLVDAEPQHTFFGVRMEAFAYGAAVVWVLAQLIRWLR